jgi:hypothetical protein
MPSEPIDFEIDDALSVDDNLRRYEEILKTTDTQLGPILAEVLTPLSDGSPIDFADVWTRLLQATNVEAEEGGRGATS